VAGWLAVVISVTFVLVFGEILPQALFTSDPVRAGYKLAWLVYVFRVVLFPLAYPIAKFLDCVLKQHHSVLFTHDEIESLFLAISHLDKKSQMQTGFGHPDEVTMIQGAMRMRGLKVQDVMVPWDRVKLLDENMELNADGLRDVYSTGLSRLPVYSGRKNNLVGLCIVKNLVVVDPEMGEKVSHYCNRKPVVVTPDTSLFDALNYFQTERTHLAIVTHHVDLVNDCFAESLEIPQHVDFLGIVTLEDIIEEMIQEEIEDETDFIVEMPDEKVTEAHLSRVIDRNTGVRILKNRMRARHAKVQKRQSTARSAMVDREHWESLVINVHPSSMSDEDPEGPQGRRGSEPGISMHHVKKTYTKALQRVAKKSGDSSVTELSNLSMLLSDDNGYGSQD